MKWLAANIGVDRTDDNYLATDQPDLRMRIIMKDSSKTKSNGRSKSKDSGPLLRFNFVKRETLPQARIDVRALEMVRAYPMYVKSLTGHEPPINEVIEQCILHTLSNDAGFVEWFSSQPPTVAGDEQHNPTT